MKRRTVLASTGVASSAIVAGCISSIGDSNDAVTPSAGTKSELDDTCGPGDRSLSEHLTDDPGDRSPCADEASPSFAIENEREREVTVDVALRDGNALSGTYTLEPGERVVERDTFEIGSSLTGTISVEGEETVVKWPAESCYRHAIALTEDGMLAGWVEPYVGNGDVEHDCYAGDDALLSVRNHRYWPMELTVSITDRCDGSDVTEDFSLPPSDVERGEGMIQNGGVYDITASIPDGDSESDEFTEGCWGVTVIVDEDGNIGFEGIAIA